MPKSRNRNRSRDLRRKMAKRRINQNKRMDEMIKMKALELMNKNKQLNEPILPAHDCSECESKVKEETNE